MRTHCLYCVASIAVVGFSVSAHALDIDSFTDGADTLMIPSGTGTLTQEETGFSMIGGQRDSDSVGHGEPVLSADFARHLWKPADARGVL